MVPFQTLLSSARSGAALRGGIDCRESGSCAVTCSRHGDMLTVANVGDSRCVMAREVEGGAGAARMAAVDLSVDHKPRRNDEMVRRRTGAPGRFRGSPRTHPARVGFNA